MSRLGPELRTYAMCFRKLKFTHNSSCNPQQKKQSGNRQRL